VNGNSVFSYTFPSNETEVYIDSELQDAYLGSVLKNRNMMGEFPVLNSGMNEIAFTGTLTSVEIYARSRWI
jgi:phage-related protein